MLDNMTRCSHVKHFVWRMQTYASEPKSWPLQSSSKKSTVAHEEDILLLQAIQDTLLACEDDVDDASTTCEEEGDGAEHRSELLMELDLREVSILRRMVQKTADPIQLREKVHSFGRTTEVKSGEERARH